MRKFNLLAVLAALALGGVAVAQAQSASCCAGGKCGTCCVKCTQCGGNCAPMSCCKK